jgi:hypothetical protein
MTAKPHENSNILNLMDSLNPNFDDGSRNMWGFCDANFNFNLLCTT